jgi:CheY-like chemotaxis protein
MSKYVDGPRGPLLADSAVGLSSEEVREAAALVDRVRCAFATLETRLAGAAQAGRARSHIASEATDFFDDEEGCDAGTSADAEGARRDHRAVGGRILILEDNTAFGRAMERIAQAYGEVVVAGTVGAANAALVEPRRRWRAFIFDEALTDGSGLEVMARARERFRRTRALLITGHLDAHKANQAYRLDAAFLAKPFRKVDLERFLESAGRSR